MINKLKEITRRIALKTLVALIRLFSRPDFLEILQIVHTAYGLVALHWKWLPELPPIS